jgi:hypothetical protein
MEEFKKYVYVKEYDSETPGLIFVDFDETNEKVFDVFTKNVCIQQTDHTKIKQLLVENISNLANRVEENFLKKFSMIDCDNEKLYIKIKNGRFFIAANGRIGKATNLLVSEDNYNKYELKSICEELQLTVLFDDSVKDLFLYRINSIDTQPGLVLTHFNDKYEFVQIGFLPEKQFLKIELK